MKTLESISPVSMSCQRWEKGLAGDPNKPCLGPGKYAGKIDFDECQFMGERLILPISNLFGTQTRAEFDSRKRRFVEEKFRTCGLDCLKEHPVTICALPDIGGIRPTIVDGHHRTRYGPLFRLNLIPCVIYTPIQLAVIFNQHMVYNQPIDERSLVADLNIAVKAALSSFAEVMAHNKLPHSIPGDISDLRERFQSF